MDTLKETAIALQENWGLEIPDIISEATILQKLAERVVQLIGNNSEEFFQLMYRLDISELKLNAALHGPDAPADIARLIYDRQIQKIYSREFFKTTQKDVDDDLKW